MQFIDLQAQYQTLQPKIDARIQAVMKHGKFIMGPEVSELERELSTFTGVRHCITCASGTEALQIIFMANGIGYGDAIFCPDITFIASVEPAMMLGATPVFCDITPDTWNLCPESLERQIQAVLAHGRLTPKAVVAVDFLGNPANYDALSAVCEQYGLLLIEDAAQSFGASYHGKPCCGLGYVAATSFFPAKPLGCYGDGGAIFTNDSKLADIFRSLRVHGKGQYGKYDNVRVGLNSRLDTLQAAVLLVKLQALRDYEINARQAIASRYNEAFSQKFWLPSILPECHSIYAQYAFLTSSKQERASIQTHLAEHEIPSMVYYPTPQHLLPVFSGLECYGEPFENAIRYCERTISVPMYPYLEEQEQELIIRTVQDMLC